TELFRRIDRFAANDRQDRFKLLDVLILHTEIIGRKHCQVTQLSRNDRTLAALFRREPTAADRPEPESFHSIEPVAAIVHPESTHCLSGHQPIERDEWVVARN